MNPPQRQEALHSEPWNQYSPGSGPIRTSCRLHPLASVSHEASCMYLLRGKQCHEVTRPKPSPESLELPLTLGPWVTEKRSLDRRVLNGVLRRPHKASRRSTSHHNTTHINTTHLYTSVISVYAGCGNHLTSCAIACRISSIHWYT